jgi:hypothetical protein
VVGGRRLRRARAISFCIIKLHASENVWRAELHATLAPRLLHHATNIA